jgi:hypothetical protein
MGVFIISSRLMYVGVPTAGLLSSEGYVPERGAVRGVLRAGNSGFTVDVAMLSERYLDRSTEAEAGHCTASLVGNRRGSRTKVE